MADEQSKKNIPHEESKQTEEEVSEPETPYFWTESFLKLQRYRAQTGHCNVESEHSPELAKWIAFQRDLYQQGLLPSNRKELLEFIGFDWEEPPKKKPAAKTKTKTNTKKRSTKPSIKGTTNKKKRSSKDNSNDAKWKTNYKKLVAYNNEHGNCNYPRYGRDRALGSWVSAQRTLSKKNKLSSDRKALLDKIGFTWRIRVGKQVVPAGKEQPHGGQKGTDAGKQKPTSKAGNEQGTQVPVAKKQGQVNDKQDSIWDDMFIELSAFYQKNGHHRVPRRENLKLAGWVGTQRRYYRDNRLQKRREAMLLDINFPFHVIKKPGLVVGSDTQKGCKRSYTSEEGGKDGGRVALGRTKRPKVVPNSQDVISSAERKTP